MKNNFTYLNSTDNALWGMMLEVNEATGHFLGYSLCGMTFIVLSYLWLKRTNDIGKSLLGGLHATTLLALILYYAGKTTGHVFLSDVFILSLLVVEVLGIGAMYYFRSAE